MNWKTVAFLAATAFASAPLQADLTYTLHLDGVDPGIAAQVSNSMAEATAVYNRYGDFDKHLNVYWNGGVPTAQANYDGVITFGGSRHTRVALHEISHTLGIGTVWNYANLMVDGVWQGEVANELLSRFDGENSKMHGDGWHIWPYGLNYDNEDGEQNRIRHVMIVEAMRCDMGIGPCALTNEDPIAGRNRLIVNRATGLVLDAPGNAQGTDMIIYKDWGGANQRWNITKVNEGVYTLRSEQAGGLALDTWNWGTVNGTEIKLFDYWGGGPQQFYIEEVESGWYRITPLIAPNQSVHAHGYWNNARVITWNWWGGQNQQWSIK